MVGASLTAMIVTRFDGSLWTPSAYAATEKYRVGPAVRQSAGVDQRKGHLVRRRTHLADRRPLLPGSSVVPGRDRRRTATHRRHLASSSRPSPGGVEMPGSRNRCRSHTPGTRSVVSWPGPMRSRNRALHRGCSGRPRTDPRRRGRHDRGRRGRGQARPDRRAPGRRDRDHPDPRAPGIQGTTIQGVATWIPAAWARGDLRSRADLGRGDQGAPALGRGDLGRGDLGGGDLVSWATRTTAVESSISRPHRTWPGHHPTSSGRV